jgi:Ni/Co efflux regulator RcnB
MRTIGKAAVMLAAGLSLAAPAEAQRVWQGGRWVSMPNRGAPAAPSAPVAPPVGRPAPHFQGGSFHGTPPRGVPGRQWTAPGAHGRTRWGGTIDGRWYAGHRAPGGWNAYRRLGRGSYLPGYWQGNDFLIGDYLAWGLAQPPYGYHWTRYYDDAVLVDDRGAVWDDVDGIDWQDGAAYADSSYDYSYSEGSAGTSYAAPYGGGYAQPIPVPAAPAYAPPPVAYGGGYVAPAPIIAAPVVAPPPVVTYGGATYGYGAAYSYAAPGTSVVVIQGAPAVTTTTVTEEVVQQSVVKVRRAAPRRVYRKPRRVACCACGCR